MKLQMKLKFLMLLMTTAAVAFSAGYYIAAEAATRIVKEQTVDASEIKTKFFH